MEHSFRIPHYVCSLSLISKSSIRFLYHPLHLFRKFSPSLPLYISYLFDFSQRAATVGFWTAARSLVALLSCKWQKFLAFTSPLHTVISGRDGGNKVSLTFQAKRENDECGLRNKSFPPRFYVWLVLVS